MKKAVFALFGLFFLTVSSVFSQVANIQTGGKFKIMEVKEVVSTNQFITPSENMRFIAFDVIIDNTEGKADVELNIFVGSIEVRDSDGHTYTPNLSSSITKPQMDPNATIEIGDLMRGWITIEIPKNIPINGLRVRLKAMKGQSSWVTIKI